MEEIRAIDEKHGGFDILSLAKFSESQQEEFEATVREPSEKVGIVAPAWMPAVAQEYLEQNIRR